jgi:hypothetical protein
LRTLLCSGLVGLLLACSSDPQAPGTGVGGGGAAGSSAAGTSAGGTSSGGGAGVTSGGSGGGGTSGSATTGGGGAASGGGGATSGGTGGGTSGGTGGGASGGTGGGAASSCSGFTSKFCDDFEAQTVGAAPKGDFSVEANDGALVVDTTKAFSGTKALHINTKKPSPTAFLNFSKQFPLNDFHGRAMFYLTRIPTAEIHWDLIDASGTTHWEIGGMYGKFMFVVDPPDHGLLSNTFPTGKWFCLQWQFKYGGQGMDNTFLAKMDGTTLDKGSFTGADAEGDKWNAGPWKQLSVGWTAYGSSDVDIEEWIDDLAIAEQPIPCPVSP